MISVYKFEQPAKGLKKVIGKNKAERIVTLIAFQVLLLIYFLIFLFNVLLVKN